MRRNSPTVYGKKTGLFHPYKPCGLTSCVTSWTLARRDLYLSPLNEMKFSDCMIENGLFHPYKLYGSTSHIIPLTPVPFMRCSFPTVYGFKTVYHCLSNRTDRKVVFSDHIRLCVLDNPPCLACTQKRQKCTFVPRHLSMIVWISVEN